MVVWIAGCDRVEAVADLSDMAFDLAVSSDLTAGKKHMFLTSTLFNGDLVDQTGDGNGLLAGATICRRAAMAGRASSNFGPNWKAWLSLNGVDAISTIDDVGPWYSTDESRILFINKNQLTRSPTNAVDQDENGTYQGLSNYVWTGTGVGGKVKPTSGVITSTTCLDWTDKTANSYGGAGYAPNTDGTWTDGSSTVTMFAAACNTLQSIYCIEQ